MGLGRQTGGPKCGQKDGEILRKIETKSRPLKTRLSYANNSFTAAQGKKALFCIAKWATLTIHRGKTFFDAQSTSSPIPKTSPHELARGIVGSGNSWRSGGSALSACHTPSPRHHTKKWLGKILKKLFFARPCDRGRGGKPIVVASCQRSNLLRRFLSPSSPLTFFRPTSLGAIDRRRRKPPPPKTPEGGKCGTRRGKGLLRCYARFKRIKNASPHGGPLSYFSQLARRRLKKGWAPSSSSRSFQQHRLLRLLLLLLLPLPAVSCQSPSKKGGREGKREGGREETPPPPPSSRQEAIDSIDDIAGEGEKRCWEERGGQGREGGEWGGPAAFLARVRSTSVLQRACIQGSSSCVLHTCGKDQQFLPAFAENAFTNDLA